MLKLDHLVINTRFDTDAAQHLFEQLGFTLTPRGYHTLGSINHAIVFGDHYLELIGLPADGKTIREEIVASPLGADGLVFRSDDPEATFNALRDAGFNATPPQTFSRPVASLGDARFTTVRLAPGQLPGGRVYFCRHLTPELVFRGEWQTHRNEAYALERLHLIGSPEHAAHAYSRLGPLAPGFELVFWTREEFDANFGALAANVAARVPRYAAITIRTPQWRETGKRAAAAGLPFVTEEAGTLVALPRFDTLLEFVP
ncbi:MAG TPA: VOC family protein [Paraburkholderia sp.]|nr:VOC family protein [Paraburkholderia sp.]